MVFLKLRRQRASQGEILMKRLGPHSRVTSKSSQSTITYKSLAVEVAYCVVMRHHQMPWEVLAKSYQHP